MMKHALNISDKRSIDRLTGQGNDVGAVSRILLIRQDVVKKYLNPQKPKRKYTRKAKNGNTGRDSEPGTGVAGSAADNIG